MANIEVPWERYGTISIIAKSTGSLGKTALQKLMYFLQEWKNVPLGYTFDLYTYGPFSADLMGDLDYTAHLGAVKVEFITNGGYRISPADKNMEIQERASDFLEEYRSDIAEVVNLFGQYSAWQLELRATLHYAHQELALKESSFSDDELVDVLNSLKPGKFKDEQIHQAINELREQGVIRERDKVLS